LLGAGFILLRQGDKIMKEEPSKIVTTEKLISSMNGYKATNKDMQCQDFQYELGKTYELPKESPLVLCRSGFHFCEQPSGVWSYYSADDTRIFKIEAWDVLNASFEPGADFKRVCRKIRFIEEIKIGGNSNTGYRNTGDSNTGDRNTGNSNTGDSNTGNSNTGYRNTGDRNTGNRNTGYRNTGYSNTGDRNTGNSNTGDRNTGDRNTGDSNTGDRNTGDSNTGDRNTGDSNTGYRNTGNSNTGYGNFCDYSTGCFCTKEQPVIVFDKPTKTKREDLPFGLMRELQDKFMQDEDFDTKPFLKIPNATVKKIKELHKKYIKHRQVAVTG
jgi:hypothetical protein